MVSQENIDQQHDSKEYRVIIWAIVFVFLLVTWYALTKVAVRVQYVRDNMRWRVKPMLFWWIVGILIFFGLLILINLRGKKEQRDKYQKDTDKK